MRLDELLEPNGGGKPASQAYWNALRKLREAWREIFDDELEADGSRAMEAFESAIENLKKRFRDDDVRGKQLLAILDVQPGEDIGELLLNEADLDDLSPNAIKASIFTELQRRGEGQHELRAILRAVLDALFTDDSVRRPRVGANRHWPRLRQYLRELEKETDWSPDGRGIRLVNSSRRGPVAKEPTDPSRLNLLIDPAYF